MKSKNPNLYILCGLSFAGKSTLAKKLATPFGAAIVEADQYIPVVEKRLPNASKLESWRTIQALARNAAREWLEAGTSVIFDDLMVDPNDRDELMHLAAQCGAGALTIYLNTSVETVRERQRQQSSKEEKHLKWEEHTQLLLSQLVPPPTENAVYVEPGYDVSAVLEEITRRVISYHRGPGEPRVTHLIASSARPKTEDPDEDD